MEWKTYAENHIYQLNYTSLKDYTLHILDQIDKLTISLKFFPIIHQLIDKNVKM